MQPKTVMVKREEPGPSSDLIGQTRADEPNIKVEAMAAWKHVAIRGGRVYLMCLIGMMTNAGFGMENADQGKNFFSVFWNSMQLSVSPAVMSVLWNTTEILKKWDIKHPEMRA